MFISIFTDELGLDVADALPVIKSWGLGHVDFRAKVFGKGIEMLDTDELRRLRQLVDDHGLTVGCLQTSLCKVHLPDAQRQKQEQEKLEGIIRAADALECRLVRSFSYWQPRGEESGTLATGPDVMQKVLDMFTPVARRAEAADLVLSFENCGVSTDEVFALLDAMNVPGWNMAWDVNNTWGCDERKQDEDAFIERMVRRANCVHVKARGAIDLVNAELIPYKKVLQTCHNLGMPGPVSAETHNFGKNGVDEDISRKVVEEIQRAWPAAVPQALNRKFS
jgi:sugar phosphate isomerase/epimerase